MNQFIRSQINNMIQMTQTFERACEMAAMKDDGRISKEEAKTLKRIHDASAKFIAVLTKERDS